MWQVCKSQDVGGHDLHRNRFSVAVLTLVFLVLSCVGALAFSLDKEIQLGKDASKEIEKEMPPSKNAKWQQDIETMGKRFLPYLNRKDIPYHFTVVEDKDNEINAFAIPGGYVYFTERMWRIMTPDERAAIMAHEITHCDHRHGVDMMLKSQQRALWLLPALVLSGGTNLAYALAWGDMIISQRYSRKMEREADESGIQLLAKAGFNSAAAVTAMKKLLAIESAENRYEISAIFASHPDTKKRVDYLSSAAISMGAKSADLEIKAVDDPTRLGNVTGRMQDMTMLYAKTSQPLTYGQRVAIKKMLWDDDAQALVPKTVVIATALTPGKFPILILENPEDHNFGDIIAGDGVYPITPEDLHKPSESHPESIGEKKSVTF